MTVGKTTMMVSAVNIWNCTYFSSAQKSIHTLAAQTGTCHACRRPEWNFRGPLAHNRIIYHHWVQSDFSMAPKASNPNRIQIDTHSFRHRHIYTHTHRTQALLAHTNRPGVSKDLTELVYWPRESVCSILRTWNSPKMEINTASEDFTVKWAISYTLPVIHTHCILCTRLPFASSYKQPWHHKSEHAANINTHCQITEKQNPAFLTRRTVPAVPFFSFFLFFHLIFFLSLMWQPPFLVWSTRFQMSCSNSRVFLLSPAET